MLVSNIAWSADGVFASSARHQGRCVQFHNSLPNEVMGGEFDVRVET
jgi:hypothetical protein